MVNRLSRFARSAGIDENMPASTSSGRSSPNPVLGSSPTFSKMWVDHPSGNQNAALGLNPIIPSPNPYVPPFSSPTLVQPLAQLRQPYLVSLGNAASGAASGVTSRSHHKGHKGPNPEDVPIRLAVAFAPSRAWSVGGGQNNLFNRGKHQKSAKMAEALYVMASHGVLLEYTLDPVPDTTIPKEKICESSNVELHIGKSK